MSNQEQQGEEEHPLVVEQLCFLLRAYLPRIGQGEHIGDLSVDQADEDVWSVSVGNSGICVDTGWEMEVEGVTGKKKAKGFRVYTMEVIAGGRSHPDEAVDVTRLETMGMGKVIEEVGRLFAVDALNGLPPLPPELEGEPEVLEEA